MKENLTFYYAVNKFGQGLVFIDYPMRDEHLGTWVGKIAGSVTMFFIYLETEKGMELPHVTFADAPVPITINIALG